MALFYHAVILVSGVGQRRGEAFEIGKLFLGRPTDQRGAGKAGRGGFSVHGAFREGAPSLVAVMQR